MKQVCMVLAFCMFPSNLVVSVFNHNVQYFYVTSSYFKCLTLMFLIEH